MKPEATLQINIEGLDQAKLSIYMIEFFYYKMKLLEAKDQRRALHATGKCSHGDCLRDKEEGDYLNNPNLSTACEFCKERHSLYLQIKSLAAKCRGIMTKVQRQVVRMPYFKQLTANNEQGK